MTGFEGFNNLLNNTIFSDFYKNKKILITGHTGFKGSWLTLWLHELKAKIIGYSLNPPTSPSMFDILKLKERIIHIRGDVRDLSHLKKIVDKYKPDIIFHMAAQSLVRLSYSDPILTYETNIMGTINLFESVRGQRKVKAIINVTSDKCYDNKEWVFAYRENDSFGGYDPYSSSKGCAEIITSAYRESFFNENDYNNVHNTLIASVRAGNIIGGGDWANDRIIPDTMESLSKNQDILIRNPNAIRPWQHVLEPISGYLLLGMRLYNGEKGFCGAWNFGPNDNSVYTVKDIVDIVIKYWGKGKIKVQKGNEPHESNFLRLDTGKSYYYLKWKNVYNIEHALFQTVSWYKKYYNNETKNDMYDYTVKQINDYVKKANENDLIWAKE